MNRLDFSPPPTLPRPRFSVLARGAGASVVVALVLSILASAPNALAARRAPAQPDSEDLKELRGRIESLRHDIQEKEESRTEARDALRESERAISEANRRLRELSGERLQTRQELGRLDGEADRLEAEVAARQEAIARLVKQRYYGGEADYLKLLLSGQDPNQTARDLVYYSYVSRAQASLLEALRARLERLRELESASRDKNGELGEIEAEQKKERDRLAAEQTARRKVLDKVSAQIRNQKRRMEALERDENRLTRLIQGLDRVIASKPARIRGPEPKSGKGKAPPEMAAIAPQEKRAAPPDNQAPQAEGIQFGGLRGSLRFPVRGELAARFGSPRQGGGPTWKGLFIRTPVGQEVRAVAPGRVVFADWMRGFGNMLILDHGEGYLSIYGNNEAVLRQVGDTVKGGEPVATTGSSGGNTDSGLYFEIRHEGRPFDPMKWLSLK